MARILLEDVNLKFHVRKFKRLFLKELIIRGLLRRETDPTFELHALKDINLDFREGDRVGIIGHNGAGKSTLLKVIAGIYAPTTGKVSVCGEISSLFDLKLGFEPDATGWENIRFRGYLQGETPATLSGKIEPTAAFSELNGFLDMPVRYYSSGMAVRLAFSVATAIDPEILLIDEILSVGDRAFRERARQRMEEMIQRARLIVMVSHELDALEELCNRAVWLDRGRIVEDGPAETVIAAYKRHIDRQSIKQPACCHH